MDETGKKMLQNFEADDEPVIKIWYKAGRATVEVNGKKIERLRSFEVKVGNEMRNGETEYPFYKIEQYLPPPTFKQASRG